MKQLIYKYKRCLSGTSLLLALVGLTSFNPFSQTTHLAKLQLEEGFLELAVTLEHENTGTRGRVKGNADDRDWLLAINKSAKEIYLPTTEGTRTSFSLNGDASDALGTTLTDDTYVYISKIEKRGDSWKVTYKIEASEKLTKAITVEGQLCSQCNDELTKEHTVTIKDLDVEALLKNDATQAQLAMAVITSDFSGIRKGFPTAKKSLDANADFTCDQDSYEARTACLQNLKKKICSRTQERRGDTNCISREDYDDEIYALVEDMALDDTMSDGQFKKIARLVRGDSQASRLLRTVSEQRNFVKHTLHFERNVNRSLDQIGRIDDRIAQLNQHWGNPWAMQQVAALEQQKRNIIVTTERQAAQFKQYYQRSSFANTRTTTGINSDLALTLKQDVEALYSDIMAPMADLFFDTSVASLDKVEYAGPTTGLTTGSTTVGRFQNPPGIEQQSWTPSNQLSSTDPRFSSGYISNQPVLIGNRTAPRWDSSSPITYNPLDPNLTGHRRYINPPRIQSGPTQQIQQRFPTTAPGWT